MLLTVAPLTVLLWLSVPVVTARPVPGWMMPLVLAVASGKSPGTMARKVGAVSDPVAGPANTVAAVCVSSVAVSVALYASG